jgi:hypothetical protein
MAHDIQCSRSTPPYFRRRSTQRAVAVAPAKRHFLADGYAEPGAGALPREIVEAAGTESGRPYGQTFPGWPGTIESDEGRDSACARRNARRETL